MLTHSGCEEALIAKVEAAIKTSFRDEVRRCYTNPVVETSQLRTMNHGDFWLNNMMFSSEDPEENDLKVTLLDFQQLIIAHPARYTDRQTDSRIISNLMSNPSEISGISCTVLLTNNSETNI